MILYDIHRFLTQHGTEHTCMTTHTHTHTHHRQSSHTSNEGSITYPIHGTSLLVTLSFQRYWQLTF